MNRQNSRRAIHEKSPGTNQVPVAHRSNRAWQVIARTVSSERVWTLSPVLLVSFGHNRDFGRNLRTLYTAVLGTRTWVREASSLTCRLAFLLACGSAHQSVNERFAREVENACICDVTGAYSRIIGRFGEVTKRLPELAHGSLRAGSHENRALTRRPNVPQLQTPFRLPRRHY